MARRSDTSVGSQLLVALLVLFAAWIVLKWVIRVVVSVTTTILVIGAILFAAWIFLGRRDAA